MARHTIAEAAKLVGKARSTLYNHAQEGRFSTGASKNGEITVDTAELIRVYGGLAGMESIENPIEQRQTQEDSSESSGLRAEIEALRAEKMAALEAQIVELRAERDAWKAQAERVTLMLEAPKPSSEPKEEKRSFWHIFKT